MKKQYTITIITLILLITAACGSSNNLNIKVSNENSAADIVATEVVQEDSSEEVVIQATETSEPTATAEPEITISEQVLLDQDGIKITAKSISLEDFFGPSIKVLIENELEQPVSVQIRNLSVNDVMIDSIFSADVAAGKKANDEITFYGSDLEVAKINTIKDIEFSFHIFDTDTWDTIFDSEMIKISTSVDSSFVQSYDDSGFVTLDRNDIKIVTKKLESEDSFWGADVYLYIENNSTEDVTIQIRDTSVNGFMIDPIFSCDVVAGKKAFDSITFMESDLEDNDIQDIEELEFYFHVFDAENWNTIFDSEIVTVSFSE